MSTWFDIFELITDTMTELFGFMNSIVIGGVSALYLIFGGLIMGIIITHLVPVAGANLNIK